MFVLPRSQSKSAKREQKMTNPIILKICSIENCEKPAKRRGWCGMHYTRWYRHGDPLAVSVIVGDDIARFWSCVQKSDNCWLWTGYTDPNKRYGQIRINGTMTLAHRYSFFLANGFYAEPQTLHSCDNPPCVNPAHLHEGTAQDNSDEMIERGRRVILRGEANGQSKLTPTDVLEIRAIVGMTICEIGKQYGVHNGVISSIRNRKSWQHI